jgi:hypothetical protein
VIPAPEVKETALEPQSDGITKITDYDGGYE